MAARAILITRPLPGALNTARRVADLGWRPVLAPMLRIMPLTPTLPDPARLQAVLATSGNAIPSIPASFHTLPLFAVGDATAANATRAGFAHVLSAGRDAAALAELTVRRCDPAGASLLLASGRGQGAPLATDLRAHGFRVLRRAVYVACPVPDLPADAQAALAAGDIAAVLLFSAETARAFVSALRHGLPDSSVARVEAIAIAPATAQAAAALPWSAIRTAPAPTQEAMLGLL